MFDTPTKRIKKLAGLILNSKLTYISLLLIILIQFILISIIFVQNKKNMANSSVLTEIKNKQDEISSNMSALQSNLMRLQADIYRLQINPNK